MNERVVGLLENVRMRHRARIGDPHDGVFDVGDGRRVRIGVDSRLTQVDGLLQLILTWDAFEVAHVGFAEADTVRIHEPDRDQDGAKVTYGTTLSWIWPLNHLDATAAARGPMYGVDPVELQTSLMHLVAVDLWQGDFFISDSPGLQTPASQYRDVPVLNQDQAVAVLSLLLRRRGVALLPSGHFVGQAAPFPLWWFYRIGALACLPNIMDWRRSLELAPDSQPRAAGEGDALGLKMYDQVPIEGVIGRFAHALRARDRILQGVLRGGGNENDDLITYELESLTLQLRGALDSAATVVASQLALTEARSRISWSEQEPRRTMQRKWQLEPSLTLEWKRLAQLLALIRNQIHSQPLQSVSSTSPTTENECLIVLPHKARLDFHAHAVDLGGAEAWGARNDGMFDPWVLTEMATASTQKALVGISQIATRKPIPDPNPTVWPWNETAATAALRTLGL